MTALASAGLALCALAYVLLAAVNGARTVLGRPAVERIADDTSLPDGLRTGSRSRIAVVTARHLALAGFVALLVPLPLFAPRFVQVAVGGLALIVLGGLVESFVAPRAPERVLRVAAPLIGLLDRLLAPVAAPLAGGLARLAARHRELAADGAADERLEELREERLVELIRDSEAEGLLGRAQGDLMREIVDTADVLVREVMTPRLDIDAVPVDATLDEMTSAFIASRHSRLPVYEGSLDHVVGQLNLRELLPHLAEPGPDLTAREIMRPVKVVPESKRVLELLRELQHAQQQLAVIVDEWGGTRGIVTLEDLIEEIVGEIRDEHEIAAEEVEMAGNGVWIVSGIASVEDLEEALGASLGDDDVDTVGGLVFSRLGRVPRVGDEIEIEDGLTLRVLRMRGRRIERVRASHAARGARAGGAGAAS